MKLPVWHWEQQRQSAARTTNIPLMVLVRHRCFKPLSAPESYPTESRRLFLCSSSCLDHREHLITAASATDLKPSWRIGPSSQGWLLNRSISRWLKEFGLWLATASSAGAVISYTSGDGDTIAAVMDRQAERSPKEKRRRGKWKLDRRRGANRETGCS